VTTLFEALDWVEARLSDGRPYLMGEEVTEADWRLYTTLVRFDPVYHGHFKCNLKRLIEYPNLNAYARRLHTGNMASATCSISTTPSGTITRATT
jgi:putative glutathione S-transferase